MAIRDALASIEGYPGVSGEITYAGTDGTPANRTIAFFEYDFDLGSSYGEVKTSLFGLQTSE
jgi:branched-chain amino acid transport system substrate-binding protein